MKFAPFLSLLVASEALAVSAPFDATPFGLPLPDGDGVMWEDAREIHRVIVHFKTASVAPDKVRLEYWGSRWPEQHLTKDRQPGGAEVGWMELGNWHTYNWRAADTEAKADGPSRANGSSPANVAALNERRLISAPPACSIPAA